MASFIEVAPWWFVELPRHKPVLFGVSGALLVANYWIVVLRPRRCAPGELCHIDTPFMRFNRGLYWSSVALFVLAAIVTYGSELVVRWL